jgi:hypothetical protein
MKYCLLLLGVGLLIPMVLEAQAPNFDWPCWLTNDAGFLVPDNVCSVPCLGDWDGDGDADLMSGVMYDGYVYYYENLSTGTVPQFGPKTLIEADGVPISVTYA